jgi:hypothetical protein
MELDDSGGALLPAQRERRGEPNALRGHVAFVRLDSSGSTGRRALSRANLVVASGGNAKPGAAAAQRLGESLDHPRLRLPHARHPAPDGRALLGAVVKPSSATASR